MYDTIKYVGLPLGVGKGGEPTGWALVDSDDAAKVGNYSWSTTTQGYVKRYGDNGKVQFLHREIMGVLDNPTVAVDHINRDKLDNRRCNLRVIAPGLNSHNQGAARHSTSRYRGVSWAKKGSGKWVAQGRVNGKNTRIGAFESEYEAAKAAAKWRVANLSHTVEDPNLLS